MVRPLRGIVEAVRGLEDVSADRVMEEYQRNHYDGITDAERDESLVLAARTLVEEEPNYSFVAARLLLKAERRKVVDNHGFDPYADFPHAVAYGWQQDHYDQRLVFDFDLIKLHEAIVPERDDQFQLLGAYTLVDRYLQHVDGKPYELPQTFFMRVAMGLAIGEDDPTARAIEFYELLSTFRFMSSTPTLFNSGTTNAQMSSCFLTTISDDIEGITKAVADNAKLSKFSGGLGNDWTPIRGTGALIKGTNGKSSGVIPFMNVMDANTNAWNQGGLRKGAVAAYLETWHLDIEDFLDLRRNTGDERRRTHDMNTANWVPDLFMERVEADMDWTLFSPNEVPDLHDAYGNDFRYRYTRYESLAKAGKIKNFRTVSAKELWRKMLTRLFETGHPWITFKDPSNLRSPQQHAGVVHSSNLCTEITLNTSADEVAVCNLGSVNLAAHMNGNRVDTGKLRETVRTAIRMLDNVIDLNMYTIPEARNANMRHRPIGLGVMGFHDALFEAGITYDSDRAVKFADEYQEALSYYAIEASSQLAEERGAYESFEGSEWSHGRLPIDTVNTLRAHRSSGDMVMNTSESGNYDWAGLGERVKQRGMRNSNVMAIAPTATIANIVGVSQGIDPVYRNLFVKSSMSGEFTVYNRYLVRDLKDFGLWTPEVRTALKTHDGSLQNIVGLNKYLQTMYKTAFEIDPSWLIDAAAARQKWIDQGQSLNLYMEEPNGRRLDAMYRHAWRSGLKTTYYLRAQGATHIEKTTLQGTDGKLTGVSLLPNPDPDADQCDACQ